MSDSKFSWVSTSYRNWELVGAVNTQYRELINIDPDAVPYIDKLSPTSFFAKSRKWYVWSIVPSIWELSDYWMMSKVTDVVKIDTTWCWWGECYYLYYQVSDDKTRFRVIRRNCDDCNLLTLVHEWYRCTCDSEKFFNLDFPVWDVIMEWVWQQQVINTLDHRFNYHDIIPVADWWDVYVWDYIVFYNASDSVNPWMCWIYRQISWVYDWYVSIDSTYTQIDEENRQWDMVWFKIFRNFWKTVGRVGNSSLNIYSWEWAISTSICWAWSWCIQSVVNHNWIINVLTDKWYNVYGWIWEDIMFFQWLNSTQVWTDKFSSVSFWDFLVIMWRMSMVAIVFDSTWKYSYKYDLSSASYDDFGIWSKYAYAVFANTLYVIWNDKRLYNVAIQWWADKYYLQLTPQSDSIFTDLDLLQKNDEAFISSYQNKLYVFINWRFDVDNIDTDKTKILIFNGDYKIRYKHIIPWWVINWTKYWLFYWDWIFQYIWDRDIYLFGDENNNYHLTSPIKTEIIFDIVNSENHWITNSAGNRVSLMTNKSLNWMKMLLWPGKYTDNTYIDIISYTNWYKFTKKITWIDNEWIDNRNNYMEWNYEWISVSECFSEMLSKCDNMNNPCDGSNTNTDVKDELESPVCRASTPELWLNIQPHRFDDYAICYDDKAYQLSPLKHIWINPQMKFNATLYTIKIVSDNYDIMNFGWAIVEYDSYPIWYKEKTWFDLEPACCNKQPKCPNQDCQ